MLTFPDVVAVGVPTATVPTLTAPDAADRFEGCANRRRTDALHPVPSWPAQRRAFPMEEALVQLFAELAWPLLVGVIVLAIAVLGKAADWLVSECVALSERSGIPKLVIGATIVSLGTTSPEAAVSVLAAVQGSPELALGNAVGSIICDTGLILGLACLIGPIHLPRRIVNRQGWVQLGAGVLLVAACWPWAAPLSAFTDGGRLSQQAGFLFVALLAWYLWQSVRWARRDKEEVTLEEFEVDVAAPLPLVIGKLALAVFLVVGSSWVLIPAVREAAVRADVPESIVAATLVAFGTSLPELVSAITAARHGHGDLAVGNIVGADVLNVFFVAGTAAAVTAEGLAAPVHFFRLLFPAMLLVLVVFRVGITMSHNVLRRPFGVVLLATYLFASLLSYAGTRHPGAHHGAAERARVAPPAAEALVRDAAAPGPPNAKLAHH
ncbi:MAG: sodium:calcium antiporter [Pirellulales bacterium]